VEENTQNTRLCYIYGWETLFAIKVTAVPAKALPVERDAPELNTTPVLPRIIPLAAADPPIVTCPEAW